jgi:hypothetical protein
MKKKLATLQKVDLRDIWELEASDFTNWLSQEENLGLLSEEIGVEIKLIRTEATVGKFKTDILAEEEATGSKVIIENQLENTDHEHLGKIVTYAAGHDAHKIIWIVSDVREEHRKAVEWLNDRTDESISFFLIKIELWQIEGSDPAPKFDVVVSPNEWAKIIKKDSSGELTSKDLQKLDFWTRFRDYVRERDARIRLQSPRPQHWYSISIGSSEAHLSLTINTRDNALGCEVYINKNKELFAFLREREDEIRRGIGESPEWIDAPKASRVLVRKPVADVLEQREQEAHFAWLLERTQVFQSVFGKLLKQFKK